MNSFGTSLPCYSSCPTKLRAPSRNIQVACWAMCKRPCSLRQSVDSIEQSLQRKISIFYIEFGQLASLIVSFYLALSLPFVGDISRMRMNLLRRNCKIEFAKRAPELRAQNGPNFSTGL